MEIRPTDVESFLLLGITHYDQRHYDLALETFLRALDIAPDHSTAFYYVGSTFLKLGKLDLAIEKYRKSIETGGDPNAWLDMGWAYLLKRDYRNSLESFRKSIDLGYFDFLACYFIGLTHRCEGKDKESQECLNECIERCSKQLEGDPDNPYLHYLPTSSLTMLNS